MSGLASFPGSGFYKCWWTCDLTSVIVTMHHVLWHLWGETLKWRLVLSGYITAYGLTNSAMVCLVWPVNNPQASHSVNRIRWSSLQNWSRSMSLWHAQNQKHACKQSIPLCTFRLSLIGCGIMHVDWRFCHILLYATKVKFCGRVGSTLQPPSSPHAWAHRWILLILNLALWVAWTLHTHAHYLHLAGMALTSPLTYIRPWG